MRKIVFVLAVVVAMLFALKPALARKNVAEEGSGGIEQIGIGLDAIQNASGSVPAAAVRLQMDKLNVDGLLGLQTTSNPSVTNFGIGVQGGYLIKQTTNLKIRAMGRFTLGTYSGGGVNATTIGLGGGLSAELFLSNIPELGLESSLLLGLLSSSGSGQSSTTFGIMGNGFTPLTLAIHYYF